MSVAKSNTTGMLYPPSVLEPSVYKKQKEYGPLELQHEEERKISGELFQKLLNLSGMRGCVVSEADRCIADYRSNLIRAVAAQLLGKDWDCEIYC